MLEALFLFSISSYRILLFISSGIVGKVEHKTSIGLCSSFADPETHLAFMESTCSKTDLYQIPKSTGNRCSSLYHWGDMQGCGYGCVVRPWAKDLDFLPLSQPVR